MCVGELVRPGLAARPCLMDGVTLAVLALLALALLAAAH
jgi:hypothetical protein